MMFHTEGDSHVVVFGFHLSGVTEYLIISVVILGSVFLMTALRAFKYVTEPQRIGLVHTIQSMTHTAETFLGYVLMLIVGTFNAWLLLVVVLCSALAYFTLWWIRIGSHRTTAHARWHAANNSRNENCSPDAVELLERQDREVVDEEGKGRTIGENGTTASTVPTLTFTAPSHANGAARPMYSNGTSESQHQNGYMQHVAGVTLSGSNPALYETSTDGPACASPGSENPILETFRLPPLSLAPTDTDSLLPQPRTHREDYGEGDVFTTTPDETLPLPPNVDFLPSLGDNSVDSAVESYGHNSLVVHDYAGAAVMSGAGDEQPIGKVGTPYGSRSHLPPPPPPPGSAMKFSPEFFRKYPLLTSFNRNESESVTSSDGEGDLEKAIRELGSL